MGNRASCCANDVKEHDEGEEVGSRPSLLFEEGRHPCFANDVGGHDLGEGVGSPPSLLGRPAPSTEGPAPPGRSIRHRTSARQAEHPVAAAGDRVYDYVRFVRASDMRGVEGIWPRSQDMHSPARNPGPARNRPSADDLVLAVSHAWRYQTHPDPLSVESSALHELVRQAAATHQPQGTTYVFYDFLSVSQRPFKHTQADRTPEEVTDFSRALLAMPRIYMLADVVLHIDNASGWSVVPGEGQLYSVPWEDLRAAKLAQLGAHVQVVGLPGDARSHAQVGLIDRVLKVNGAAINSLEDLEAACGQASLPVLVEMERLPFGVRNAVPAGERGWIYLERFCSMVKVAMVDASLADKVVASDSQAIVEQILDGGRRLREAVAKGESHLREELYSFFGEVRGRRFSSASVDKQSNTGGCSGKQTDETADDATIVARIMEDLVRALSEHWQNEVSLQRQRQLVLAVGRGDTVDVVDMLQAQADPNFVNEQGTACLHIAAKRGDVAVIDVLIQAGALCTLQDNAGRTPAHFIPLWARLETVEMFKRLAADPEVLALETAAGVSVTKHFWVWSSTAQDGSPYEPMYSILKEYTRAATKISPHKTFAKPRVEQRCRTSPNCMPHVSLWEAIPQPSMATTPVAVVFLAMQMGLPWSLQEEAVDYISNHLCERFNVKLYALTHGVPYNLPEGTCLSQFHMDLKERIEELPLPEKFFIVDNSFGAATALIWRMKERLSGAMVINSACFFAEEYLDSAAHRKLTTVMLQRAQERRHRRDCEALCKTSMSNYLYGDAEVINLHSEAVLSAIQASGDEFWSHIATTNEWCPKAMTEALAPLGHLDLDVTLACSAHAPMSVVQESMARLHESLLPSAVFAQLASSKGWWELDQVEAVADELLSLIERNMP